MRSAPCDLSTSAARTDALFASALQRSDEPSAVQVKQAIAAATRMRWARTAAAGAFGDSPSDPRYAVRMGRSSGVCPAPRAPRDMAGRPQTRTTPQAHVMLLAC